MSSIRVLHKGARLWVSELQDVVRGIAVHALVGVTVRDGVAVDEDDGCVVLVPATGPCVRLRGQPACAWVRVDCGSQQLERVLVVHHLVRWLLWRVVAVFHGGDGARRADRSTVPSQAIEEFVLRSHGPHPEAGRACPDRRDYGWIQSVLTGKPVRESATTVFIRLLGTIDRHGRDDQPFTRPLAPLAEANGTLTQAMTLGVTEAAAELLESEHGREFRSVLPDLLRAMETVQAEPWRLRDVGRLQVKNLDLSHFFALRRTGATARRRFMRQLEPSRTASMFLDADGTRRLLWNLFFLGERRSLRHGAEGGQVVLDLFPNRLIFDAVRDGVSVVSETTRRVAATVRDLRRHPPRHRFRDARFTMTPLRRPRSLRMMSARREVDVHDLGGVVDHAAFVGALLAADRA